MRSKWVLPRASWGSLRTGRTGSNRLKPSYLPPMNGLTLPSPRSGSRSVHLSGPFLLGHAQCKAQLFLPSQIPSQIPTHTEYRECTAVRCMWVEGRDTDLLPHQLCSLCSPTSQEEAGLSLYGAVLLQLPRHPHTSRLCASGMAALIQTQANASPSPRRIR